MPTYDYRCGACGHALEVFQSISESPKRKCPSCGKAKLERQIGAGAGILFKGGGFYQTDYRSESYKKAEGAERSESSGRSESSAESKSSASTDSKHKSDASAKKDADRKGQNAPPAAPAGGEPRASKPPKEGKASKSAAKKKGN